MEPSNWPQPKQQLLLSAATGCRYPLLLHLHFHAREFYFFKFNLWPRFFHSNKVVDPFLTLATLNPFICVERESGEGRRWPSSCVAKEEEEWNNLFDKKKKLFSRPNISNCCGGETQTRTRESGRRARASISFFFLYLPPPYSDSPSSLSGRGAFWMSQRHARPAGSRWSMRKRKKGSRQITTHHFRSMDADISLYVCT